MPMEMSQSRDNPSPNSLTVLVGQMQGARNLMTHYSSMLAKLSTSMQLHMRATKRYRTSR